MKLEIEKIITRAEELEKETVNVCSNLVKCHSDHPEDNTDSCVYYMKKFFDRNDIENEIYEKTDGKPNIVAHIKGQSHRKIMWLGHNDVVPVGELESWKYPPFSGNIADGKIWGRGSSDMKGSNSSAMIAAKILSEFKPPIGVDFWFTADEETGGEAGARWLAETGVFQAEVAIVGDSSGCDQGLVNIGLGNKGGMGCQIVVRGKTAHGSTPYLGDNAIDKLLNVIPYIKKLGEFELDPPEELISVIESTTRFMLKDVTLNPTQREEVKRLFHYPSGPSLNIIRGGVKSNVVPDSAEARFDIRLTPGVDSSKVKKRLEDLIIESGVKDVTLLARVSPMIGYFEKVEEPAVQAMAEVVTMVTGESPTYTLAPWGTDAVSVKRNIRTSTHPQGIPCILFGPMHRDQLHQPNEYVSIENLVKATKVYSLYPFFYN